MTDLIFDDIGSFPLPEGVTKEWMVSAYSKRDSDEKLFEIIGSAFKQKVDSGVGIASYPQFQDMNEQFLSIINDPECVEEPFKVKEESARILELEILERTAAQYKEETGEKLDVRISVTGPLELYLKEFGGTQYTDILNTLALSIDRFISNAINSVKNFNIKTISIDEPSIGINPQIMFDDAELIEALSISTAYAGKQDADVEIHLHSPLHYKIAANTPTINVIGVESAANPSYLDLIDKKVLEDTDSFLRTGIARTDIFNLASILNEKHNTNVWKDTQYLPEIITEMETPHIIAKRLENAYSIFGDRIKYVGPDCGLGSWPTQEIACGLLSNIKEGISIFQNK